MNDNKEGYSLALDSLMAQTWNKLGDFKEKDKSETCNRKPEKCLIYWLWWFENEGAIYLEISISINDGGNRSKEMTEIEFLLDHIVYCDIGEGGKEVRWRRSQRKEFTRSMNSSISSVIQIVMFRPLKEGQKLFWKALLK